MLRLSWGVCLVADERAQVVEESHPVIWVFALLLSSLIAAAVETLVLRLMLRRSTGKRGFWLLSCANVLCLSIAAYRTAVYARAFPIVA